MSSPNQPIVVVVLAKSFPVPPEAGSPRPFHLIRELAGSARLHCVAGVRDDERAWAAFLSKPGVASLFESVSVAHAGTSDSRAAQPLTFLSGRPRHDLRFRQPALLREMRVLTRQVAREKGPALFLCIGIDALQFVPFELWPYCIIDAVDPGSLMLEKRVESGAQLTMARRLKLYLAQFGMRRFEDRMFGNSFAVAYNSNVDIGYLLRRSPDAPVVRVIDGCDTAYFDPDFAEVDENPDEIMFNGHMRYAPNLDGAVHLVDDIMPRVWEQRPETKVLLVGPDPNEGLARYRDDERVVVTGFVDDVRPYLKRAAVVVSALRTGTGMKNKLQAGLAMRKAMVVSSVTAEGFDGLEPGRHALVTDDEAEFADEICSLLAEPERRARMGKEGQQLIQAHFSWRAAAEALEHAVEECPRWDPQDREA